MNLRSGITAFLVAIAAARVFAATPRDELLMVVPADAGFVVIVQDLRGHSERRPMLAEKLLRTDVGKALAGEAITGFAAFQKEVLRETGLTWAKLRDDIVGDAVVFVYRPGPPEKPEAEESLILLHARDPKVVAEVFAHIDANEKKSGKLKSVRSVDHAGQSYRHRQRSGEPDEYQFQRGSLVAFGSSEAMIRQIMMPEQGQSQLAKKLVDLGVDRAVITWWVNPRAFDSALAAKAAAAKGPDAAVLAGLTKHWKAIDGAALFLDAGDDGRIGLAFAARTDAMPTATRLFLHELAKPSAVLAAFPDDALVRLGGRLAIDSLLEVGAEFLPEGSRTEIRTMADKTLAAALGSDVLAALPARLGPDWGVCVTATAAEKWPTVTAAIRLTAGPAEPPVVPRVLDGLNALATFAVVGYNSKNADRMTLRSERQGDVDVRYFENDGRFPAAIRPSYAWKGGYLVVASSPAAIGRFSPPNAASTSAEAPMLKLALRGWAQYIRHHGDEAAELLAGRAGIPMAEAKDRLAAVIGVLELFEGVDLSIKTEPGRAVIVLRLRSGA